MDSLLRASETSVAISLKTLKDKRFKYVKMTLLRHSLNDSLESRTKAKDISKMDNQDIRWQQRFANYKRALSQLGEFLQNQNLRTNRTTLDVFMKEEGWCIDIRKRGF